MNLHIETKNQEGQRHWTHYGFFRIFGQKRQGHTTSPTENNQPSATKSKSAFDFPGFVAYHSGGEHEEEGKDVVSYSVCSTKPKRTTAKHPVSTRTKRDSARKMEPPSRGGKYGEDEVITKPIDIRSQRNLITSAKDRIKQDMKQDKLRRWTKSPTKVPNDGQHKVQEPQSVAYSLNYRPATASPNTMAASKESFVCRRRHTLGSASPASSCILSLATEDDFDDDDEAQEEFEILCRKLSTQRGKEALSNRNNQRCDDGDETTKKIMGTDV